MLGKSGILKGTMKYTKEIRKPYLQHDSQWESQLLYPSRKTIGESGCLVCCFAEMLSCEDSAISPGGLCNALILTRSFNSKGELKWANLARFFPLAANLLASGIYKLMGTASKDGFHYVLSNKQLGIYDSQYGNWKK